MNQLKDALILVVDDEKILRGAIRFELEMEGAIVSEASGGREAFDLIKQKEFDLILSDVRMPDGDGVELLDNIKKQNAMTPVVMLITAFVDIKIEQAYQKGCAGIIAKPFDPEVLVKQIARALKTHPNQWAEKLERVKLETDVKIEHSSFPAAIQERIFNISKGGMFVSTQGPFPKVGSGLTFRLTWLDNQFSPFQGEGIVRWIRSEKSNENPTGYGVEFFNLSEETIVNLSEIIKKLKNKIPYIPVA